MTTTTTAKTARPRRKSDGVPFEDWKRRANALCIHKTGLHPDDFPDWGWSDAYEDDSSVAEAVRDFLTESIEEGGR